MARLDVMDWIRDGEKYALVGLEAHLPSDFESLGDAGEVRAIAGAGFTMPNHWKEWLGTLRAEEVAEFNLFFVATKYSAALGILDGENLELERLVWNAYIGLLFATSVSAVGDPVHLSGSRVGSEIDVRQHRNLEAPGRGLVTGYGQIDAGVLRTALSLGAKLSGLRDPERTGRHWHLTRTATVFVRARETRDILDRIHQFTRCIEGLILPATGSTRKQFCSRTELMIGPNHHQLMGDIFDVRSAVEHLHEDRYLHPYKREVSIKLVKWEAIVSEIARLALARVLDSALLRAHFGSEEKLAEFWALPDADRRAVWGPPVNPLAVLKGFKPDYLSDGQLGGAD